MDTEPALKETTADLTALLGSRICHDLISPLGAISNGVELLLMSNTLSGPEIALISESVAAANARIRLFRVAFGTAGADQAISPAEVHATLQDLNRSGRMQIHWQVSGTATRRDVKLAFLALLCLESAMPRGGIVTVRSGEQDWMIRAEGDRLKIDRPVWDRITGRAAGQPLAAAHVQFALFADEAHRQGRMTRLVLDEQRIELAF